MEIYPRNSYLELVYPPKFVFLGNAPIQINSLKAKGGSIFLGTTAGVMAIIRQPFNCYARTVLILRIQNVLLSQPIPLLVKRQQYYSSRPDRLTAFRSIHISSVFYYPIMSLRIGLISLCLMIQLFPIFISGQFQRSRLVARQKPNIVDISGNKATRCDTWSTTPTGATCNQKKVTACGFANDVSADASNTAQLINLVGVATGCSKDTPYKAIFCASYSESFDRNANGGMICVEAETKKSHTCTKINYPIKCAITS